MRCLWTNLNLFDFCLARGRRYATFRPSPHVAGHQVEPPPQKVKDMKTPSIKELAAELSHAKRHIEDDMIAMDESAPSIDVTLACDETGFALQLGDNSFSGPAYGFRHWGVAGLYRNSNCRELARDLIGQCRELDAC
jgi:hypothetical protein